MSSHTHHCQAFLSQAVIYGWHPSCRGRLVSKQSDSSHSTFSKTSGLDWNNHFWQKFAPTISRPFFNQFGSNFHQPLTFNTDYIDAKDLHFFSASRLFLCFTPKPKNCISVIFQLIWLKFSPASYLLTMVIQLL